MDGSGFRLKTFLQESKIQQLTVAVELGMRPQYINAICQGRKGVSKQKAQLLQEKYGVSAGWLLTGEGEMYAEKQGVASELPEVDDYGQQPSKSFTHGKPYYNVDFALGFPTMENDQTVNPEYLIDFPPYNDCDCWCNAHGNSMSPTISSGDIVALKKISDISVLINGDIYAIVTKNGLRTIKRVRDNGETITLIADNPTIGTQDVPKDIISTAYLVKGVIKMF